jgi:hypothetical protein
MRLQECLGTFDTIQGFIGGNVREAIHEGRSGCAPICLSEIEGLHRYLVLWR